MSIPPDFDFRCSTTVFPAEELAVLAEQGARLEALAAGDLQPQNAADEHFLAMHREETEAQTLPEKAWQRLVARREYERELADTTPPEPPADYGMIEFDADPCWW